MFVLHQGSYWDFCICSFKEISKTTYALVLYAIDNNVISVAVADNQTLDVAGNSNIASSVLQVRHCKSPVSRLLTIVTIFWDALRVSITVIIWEIYLLRIFRLTLRLLNWLLNKAMWVFPMSRLIIEDLYAAMSTLLRRYIRVNTLRPFPLSCLQILHLQSQWPYFLS